MTQVEAIIDAFHHYRIVHENEACFTEQDLRNFNDLTNEIILN